VVHTFLLVVTAHNCTDT